MDKQLRWPEIFSDLVGLLSQTEDFETQKLYIRFVIKTLQIFDEEIVERPQAVENQKQTQQALHAVKSQIKDFVRFNSIKEIIGIL